ncbi:TPM domain-containing protein [Ornithinimicrobium pratense]|nr:TPM domain-containing protein [Ornithinimicrobium pratense]
MPDVRPSRPRSRRAAATLATLAVAGLLATGPTAQAQEPIDLPGPVTDRADVLSSSEETEVVERIEALQQETGLQLFVVFVDEFTDPSGARTNGPEWAQLTSEESGMGHGDLVLAVAVEQRAYGLGDIGGTLSSQAVQRVQLQDVEPRLGQDDWAGAAEAAVNGFAREHARAASGGGISSDRPVRTRSSGGLGNFTGALLMPLLIGGGAVLAIRAASRSSSRTTRGTAASAPAGARGVSLQELERQSAEALVGMDNAVRSAEEELAFAEAQFGRQRTEAFRGVLEQAKAAAKEAFSLRQQLDDDQREPDDVRRSMLSRIVQLTSQARRTLDEHTAEFATLRALQDRAPQFLDELTTRARETRERLPTARQEIDGLAARHPREALVTVRAHLQQATGLLDSADGFVIAGRQSLERDDRPSAVAAARAAEESIGQAASLLDAVSRADSDLASAAQQLSRGIASLTADIQDAQRLAPHEPTVGQSVQRAREAIEQAQAARSSGDPLRALADLDVAEHDLDTLLEPMREQESHATKMRGDFTERFTRVGARLQSINQTIATRRGAISSGARTRMSEALRLYEEARTTSGKDPRTAMALLTRAEQLGEQALTEANNDLGSWGGPGGSGGGGIDPWSVILGGILLGGNRGGGRRHSGGWGGGGGFSGGSFGGGSFGGGSFGGGSFGGGSFGGGGGGGGSFTGGRF